MKNTTLIIFTLTLLFGRLQAASLYYNTFTTNEDSAALAVVTNITSATVQSSVRSQVNEGFIRSIGGITTNNYSTYTDTNGAAAYWHGLATNYSQTAIPYGVATISSLTAATNALYGVCTNFATTNAEYQTTNLWALNPLGFLYPSATNNMTPFGTNVVTSIQSGGGFTINSSVSSLGTIYAITASGTNNVSITNLNATTLAGYGALTTNRSTWTNVIAPINDWTNAAIYTNGLVSLTQANSLYQPIGDYLTTNSFLNYNNVANAPVIPSTNGFVGQSITNGYATTNWVVSQGYAAPSTLAPYATTGYVSGALSGLATTNSLAYTSNSLQAQITATTNALSGYWPTNQSFVGGILVSSNMTVSLATNNGVITATIGSWGGAVVGLQPASANLTNWSGISTNRVIIGTNIITTITPSTGMSASYSTNAGGVTAILSSSVTGQSPSAWQSVTFTTSAGSQSYTWATPLAGSPTSTKVYYNGSAYTAMIASSSTSGFTYSDGANIIGTNKSVTVIGVCY